MKRALTRNVRLPASRRLEGLLMHHPAVQWTARRVATLALSAMIWPRYVAPYRWELVRLPMPLACSPAFHGYKILQLTDLHAGSARQSYLLRAIERCLAEKPDLAVITGDLIDYEPHSLPAIREVLALCQRMMPPDGILAIFGNHDYNEYSWRHTGPRAAHRTIHRRLVQIVQDSGVHLLRNESIRITRPNPSLPQSPHPSISSALVIVGLDELWPNLADPQKAFDGIGPTDATICLQHNPDGINILRPYPWQWMLCGHTHGGQALLPGGNAFYLPMEHRELVRGLYHFPALEGQSIRQRTMYVSRGLGHSTPIRIFCRPEATLFTIEAHPVKPEQPV